MGRTAFVLSFFAVTACVPCIAQHPPIGIISSSPAGGALPRMASAASAAFLNLDATGDRTVDGIEEYTATVTIGPLDDQDSFQAVCTGDPARLLTFTRLFALALTLQGTVTEPTCHPGSPDGYVLTLHLHNELGKNNLFFVTPPAFELALVAPEPPDTEERPLQRPWTEEDMKKAQEEAAAAKQQPLALFPVKTRTSRVSITLPRGWTPGELPAPENNDTAFFTFTSAYTFADGKLTREVKLVMKKEKVEPIERAAFDKWLEDSPLDTERVVHLESTIFRPSSAYGGKTDAEKQSAELMSKASQATTEHKFAEAEDLLKQAQAADPGHQMLHHYRGELAEAQGRHEEALKEYREELRAFPATLVEMESIADVLRTMGRQDEATATLQAWMTADLDNPFPAIDLMNSFHNVHRDDLAAAAGDQAMLILHDDARRSTALRITYAHELMLTGHTDKAASILDDLLTHTTDGGIVNDASYFLSQAGIALERTEKLLRDALLDYDITDVEPGEDDAARVRFSRGSDSLLFFSWDTLGWILYQEKKTTEAEGFIRAAWRNHQDPAIGLHLGTLLAAQDKPVEALDIYHLALASIPEKDRAFAAGDADVVAIHREIDRLEKEGKVSTIRNFEAALQEIRTFDVGPSGTRRGEEPYAVRVTTSNINGFPTDYRKPKQEPMDFANAKVPADFFPPGSHAAFNRQAILKCTAAKCTLTFQR